MIMLYATPRSGNAHKVRLALAFLGLSWEEQPTDAAARQTAAFAGRFEYQDLLDELEQALLEIAQETEPLPRASGENLMFRMKVIESKIDPQEGQL